jgi:beta-glucanase (GH16 family)
VPAGATAAPPSDGYTLQWQEDFRNATQFDKRWRFRAPGWRKEGYLNSPDTVLVDFDNGQLIIRTEFGQPNKAGMISTQGLVLFEHGYFEAQVTLPRKPGNHIGFWLKSERYDEGGAPSSHGVEIDVFEYLPRTPTTAYFNLHAFGYGDRHRTVGSKASDVLCSGCTHVVGLEWTPDAYVFYVDGRQLWRTTEFVTAVPHYLILSSHTSRWAGEPKRTPDSDEVRFHYVRYYRQLSLLPSKAMKSSLLLHYQIDLPCVLLEKRSVKHESVECVQEEAYGRPKNCLPERCRRNDG